MLKKILAGSLCSIALLTLPFLRLACGGGNSPPTVGVPIITDITLRVPEAVRYGVWGASGYVEATALCASTDGDWNNYVEVSTGAIWFGGGGTAQNPGYELTLECPWYAVYMLHTSAVSWG